VAPARRAAQVTEPPTPTPRGRGSFSLATDVKHALRAIAARRFDTALTVGLLALGLATTSSIFAVADALVINPVPFAQSDRLVQIWSTQGQSTITGLPRDLAVRWLERTDLFSSGGVYIQATALLTSSGDPELIPAAMVSPGTFETLGVRPILGRNFSSEEGRAGTGNVVIISADVWASRFGRSSDVVGRTLHINDKDYAVVGVMADDFRFPFSRQRIWFPFDFRNPPPEQKNSYVTLTARMRPGLTRQQLTERVEAAGPAIAAQAARPWRMGATTRYMDRLMMDDQTRKSIWLLFGATVLLMLTVCANVANLGLSQALSRVRDAAIRSALGASRWRMIRQTMVEQLAVGALALVIALPLTIGAMRLAEGLLPISYTLSSLNKIDLDGRLLAMMVTLALSAPLLSGLIPAVAGSRPSVLTALKQESRSVAGSRGARWFRRALVVLEVACSVVLLVSAALLVRSFVHMQGVDKGFDSRNLISVNVGFPSAHFADGVSRDLYMDQAIARLRQLPGVTMATAASGVPPDSGGIQFGNVESDGGGAPTDLVASVYDVQPDFFEDLDIPLLSGRTFNAGESDTHVVISHSLAAKMWPGQNAIGHRFRWDEAKSWSEVIGVAGDVRESVGGRGQFPQIYSLTQRHTPSTVAPRDAIAGWQRIAIRASDPTTAIPQVRDALKGVSAAILVQTTDRVDDLLSKELDRPRFLLALMLVFAGAGLVLAAVGVYGVLSCVVSEQMREHGIRLMLGASPASITRAILFGGLGTTGVGLLLGMAAAFLLGKTINSMLFQVESHDATSYAVVVGVLVSAALTAAWRPARRAATVDPTALLRND
jgi:putative ABC transport system permease protein